MVTMKLIVVAVFVCMATASELLFDAKNKHDFMKDMTLDVKVKPEPKPEPKPRKSGCCFPKVFEGKMRELVGSSTNNRGVIKGAMTGIEGYFAYDMKAKKAAVKEVIMSGQGHKVAGRFWMVVDYGKKKLYVVNEATKQCTIMPIPKTPEAKSEQCIPKNATHLGKEVMGGSLKVDTYHFGQKSKVANVTAFLTVTKKRGFIFPRKETCLPVTETVFGSAKSNAGIVGFTASIEFFNVREKIADRKVFTPPRNCSAAPPELVEGMSDMMKAMQHKFMGMD